jgi:cellobiose phosphorylase
MAPEKGESVAFTNAYSGNLKGLADMMEHYNKITGKSRIIIAREIESLLADSADTYDSVSKKRKLLETYCRSCRHEISGETVSVEITEAVQSLRKKADWICWHIRENEWVTDEEGQGWFNGYYDNNGKRVEGRFKSGIRMMLTSQVFSIMAGTAGEEQVKEITKSADCYLYDENIGGYRLNTDFKELKTDLGRMFGFAYGHKENGAVFSHMAVMYANALYQRGFAKEGYKALSTLAKQSLDFGKSMIYPGIPEYFNQKGRGMYHYLTGAASWYLITVIMEAFGARGVYGDLLIEPKLVAEQFDSLGNAVVKLTFRGKKFRILYRNENGASYGGYKIASVRLDHCDIETDGFCSRIPSDVIDALDRNMEHCIVADLK